MIRVFAAVRPDARAVRHLAGALGALGVFPELAADADWGALGSFDSGDLVGGGPVGGGLVSGGPVGGGPELSGGPGLGGGVPALRPVAPQNWHITLAFYGDIPQGAVPDLAAALRMQVGDVSPGEAHLAGAGVFGGRTLWVGARDEPRGLLRSLAQRAAAAGEDAGVGIADEGRPRYRAHLTVARLSSRWVAQERNRQRSKREYEARQRRRRGEDGARRGHGSRRGQHLRDQQRRGDARRGDGQRGGWNAFAAAAYGAVESGISGDALGSGVLDAPSRALAVYEGPVFPVEEVELIASRLGEGPGGGPAYELLETVTLPGAGFGW